MESTPPNKHPWESEKDYKDRMDKYKKRKKNETTTTNFNNSF